MKKNLSLSLQIIILVSGLIVILLLTSTMLTSKKFVDEIQEKIEINCMNISNIIAKDEFIIEKLRDQDSEGLIQPFILEIVETMEEVDFIIIADMEAIRYSHPLEKNIGLAVVGDDIDDVVKYGESYISKSEGSMGESIRAFVPICDDKVQIGFVITVLLTENLHFIISENNHIILSITLGGIVLGLISAIALSLSIKKSIRGLEPYEIARLYDEKESMLNTIEEGIIAIDNSNRITMINKAALSIMSLNMDSDVDLLNRDINEIFPDNNLSLVMESGIAEYNSQEMVKNGVIIANRIPIIKNGEILGALASFHDKTKVIKLAEEITGIKQIADGLRANNHEFMNKLHVILGLIHASEFDELKDYVIHISNSQRILTKNIYSRINNTQIEALLIGKFSHAEELGIDIDLFEDSQLEESSLLYTNYLITIIGNLIDNAFEAIRKNPSSSDKIVRIGIIEQDDEIEIIVTDTGIGIENSQISKIFDKGYSTKEIPSGTGLYLVKKSIKILRGEINVTSIPFKKTQFHVILRKVIKND